MRNFMRNKKNLLIEKKVIKVKELEKKLIKVKEILIELCFQICKQFNQKILFIEK